MKKTRLVKKISGYYREKWFFAFVIIFVVLMISLLVLEYTNRSSGGIWLRDFEVFHKAGSRVMSGENLYRPIEDGYYRFKYSPLAAVFFIPFSLLPLKAAEVAYWLFLSVVVVAGFYLSLVIVNPRFREGSAAKVNTVMLLAGLVLAVHIWAELTLGQVNEMLMVIYLGVAYSFISRKVVATSALLAASLFIKPYGLIFLPYFVVKRRFREVATSLSFAGLFLLAPVVFFRSWEMLVEQYQAWREEIVLELSMKDNVLSASHTVFSIFARYSPLRFVDEQSQIWFPYKGTLVLLIALLALWMFYRGRGVANRMAPEFAFIMGLLPLLAFTNNNSFIFISLAVLLLLFGFSEMGAGSKALTVAGCLLVGGNFFNQFGTEWGDNLFQRLDDWSLLGIGTILLVGVVSGSRLRRRW